MRFMVFFVLVAIAEMATFFWVGSIIGIGWALAIALTTAILGSILVRRAGVSVIGRIQQKTRQGEIPGRELSDGAAILVAGAFLISPGFITDTLGFLLLLPPVRDLVYRVLSSRFSRRFTVLTNFQAGRRDVIEGEIIDIDPE